MGNQEQLSYESKDREASDFKDYTHEASDFKDYTHEASDFKDYTREASNFNDPKSVENAITKLNNSLYNYLDAEIIGKFYKNVINTSNDVLISKVADTLKNEAILGKFDNEHFISLVNEISDDEVLKQL